MLFSLLAEVELSSESYEAAVSETVVDLEVLLKKRKSKM